MSEEAVTISIGVIGVILSILFAVICYTAFVVYTTWLVLMTMGWVL